MRKLKKQGKNKKVIVIPDVHVPFECKKSITTLLEYIRDNYWDEMIFMGDFMDYFCIAKYNNEKPGLVEGTTVMKEGVEGRKVLDTFIQAAHTKNKSCKVVYLEGNHEFRATEFAYKNPHLRGIIEVENLLELDKRGVLFIPSWSNDEMYPIGNAFFHHGRYTNQYHSKKHVDNYGVNIFYGHTHTVQSHVRPARKDKNVMIGHSLGCLCEYPNKYDYMKGAPRNWQKAFATFHFHPDGNFNYYVTHIRDGKFIAPDGKLYTGSKK